jgi:glucokinase
MSSYVIAIDVGGSSIKSGAVTDRYQLEGAPLTTPLDSWGELPVIIQTVSDVLRKHVLPPNRSILAGVAIGFPGPFDYERGIGLGQGDRKFASLYGVDVGARLRKQLPEITAPILFTNDARAAIAGEVCHGAGSAYQRVIGITLGTGLGSAFFVEGALQTAGEHIPKDGYLYPEPWRGRASEETFSSRGLLERLQAAAPPTTSIAEAAVAARSGDARLRAAFAEFGRDLGLFLSPYVKRFSADAVVCLGGVSEAFDLFGPALTGQLPSAVHASTMKIPPALAGLADIFFRGSLSTRENAVPR